MRRKGTQRRFAVALVALAAVTSVAIVEMPASAAFPPGHKVFTFNYKYVAKSKIAKLEATIPLPPGTFKGGIDLVTGQVKGGIKLPNVTFAYPAGGLASVTAALTQVKPVAGQLDQSTSKITATTSFVLKIVSAYAASGAANTAAVPGVTLPTLPITLPTLPGGVIPPGASPVNLVGKACASAAPIKLTLKGTARPATGSKLLGTYTIPKFKGCGAATALLNKLLSGPGNTYAATATPITNTPSPSLPITLPTLPGGVTLPTLPGVTLPTLPGVTLPTLPITLPTIPGVTLPALPVP